MVLTFDKPVKGLKVKFVFYIAATGKKFLFYSFYIQKFVAFDAVVSNTDYSPLLQSTPKN